MEVEIFFLREKKRAWRIRRQTDEGVGRKSGGAKRKKEKKKRKEEEQEPKRVKTEKGSGRRVKKKKGKRKGEEVQKVESDHPERKWRKGLVLVS